MKWLRRIFPASAEDSSVRFKAIEASLADLRHEVSLVLQSNESYASARRAESLVEQRFLRRLLGIAEDASRDRVAASQDRATLLRFVRRLMSQDDAAAQDRVAASQDRATLLRFVRRLMSQDDAAAQDRVAASQDRATLLRFVRRLMSQDDAAAQDRVAASQDRATLLRFVRRLMSQDDAAAQDRARLLAALESSETFGRDLLQGVLQAAGAAERKLDALASGQDEVRTLAERGRRQSLLAQKAAEESVWAHVFHDVTSGSSWLKDRQFAAGRWAVGYAYLYVLYRIMDEAKPRRILDIGLGQTSRLIAQYVQAHPGVEHVIVESDPQWIAFMRKSFAFPASTRILQLDYAVQQFRGVEGVRQYRGFREALKGQTFDLVSIDAPYAGDMPTIGRVDVVELMPGLLADTFALLMDDTQRPAEGAAFDMILAELAKAGRATVTGIYRSEKDFSIITSEDQRFLASL